MATPTSSLKTCPCCDMCHHKTFLHPDNEIQVDTGETYISSSSKIDTDFRADVKCCVVAVLYLQISDLILNCIFRRLEEVETDADSKTGGV